MAKDNRALLGPLFARIEASHDLSEEEKALLAEAAGDTRSFGARQDIVVQGSRPKVSSLLVEGLSGRYVDLRDGTRRISGLHVSGDFVDLHSMLLKPMDHGILAMSDCTVLQFPHENLLRVTNAHPQLTRLLWFLTLVDAAVHRQWLVARGGLDSLGEAAHLLCELYLRHRAAALTRGETFTLPMTQQDFGNALGKSAVQTNRVIQTLRKLGFISWKGQQIAILDWDSLAELGEFDPTYLQLKRGTE